MGQIDAHIAQLSAGLVGPRRAKADLVTEAHHGLLDAAEALQAEGHARPEAERLAVAEFGAVKELLPGYQAELALVQLRRTALLVFTVLVAQMVAWGPARRRVLGEAEVLTGLPAALDMIIGWLGFAAMLAAAAAVVSLRYLPTRRDVAAFAGTLTLALSALIAFLGCAATLAGGADPRWTAAFGLLPMVLTAFSARRCLRAARA